MFPDWISLAPYLLENYTASNPLHCMPREAAIEVCRTICRNLAPRPAGSVASISGATGGGSFHSSLPPNPNVTSFTGNPHHDHQGNLHNLPAQPPSRPSFQSSESASSLAGMESEEMVQYSMEVVSFALSLDFEDHEIIRDGTFAYCDWLTVLGPSPKPSVPDCIRNSPNLYAQRMIKHFANLFLPRPRQNAELVQKQGVLCHRALRSIQDVFRTSSILESETWDVLLQTLLAITDSVFHPSSDLEEFTDYISKRLLAVLFDLWLLACQRAFPAAVFWKAFYQLALSWRHRLPVIEEWLRVSVLLFEKVLHLTAGKAERNSVGFRSVEQSKLYQDWKMETSMSSDVLLQAQMRCLLLLGNVADIAASDSQGRLSDKNVHMILASASDSYRELSSASVVVQPVIFLKLMTCVTMMVDLAMNLANNIDSYLEISWPIVMSTHGSLEAAPSAHRVRTTETLSLLYKNRPLRCEVRLPCRGLLHLFGPWLFRASLLARPEGGRSGRQTPETDDSLQDDKVVVLGLDSDWDAWQAGRAEAVGTLCRLYSFISGGQYLDSGLVARMGLLLAEAVTLKDSSGVVLTNAIRNCHDMFRSNLPGFETLLPAIIPAIEMVLLHPKLPKNILYPEIIGDDLRCAALHLLSSIVCLPKYFDLLPCYDVRWAFERSHSGSGPGPGPGPGPDIDTFGSLSYRLLDLTLQSIVKETNPSNCMLLLGCTYVLFTHAGTENSMEDSADIRFIYGEKVCTAVTYLLQNPLWLQDNNLSYACLEFLHTSARYSPHLLSSSTTKMLILRICMYIQDQSQRPSKAHSKELHNKIIVAYQCLLAWLHVHASLLQDALVLATVSEVVELGLTGNKSPKMLKASQSFQPISTRVRDAAELALIVVLEFIGCSRDPGCYPYVDTMVKEEDIGFSGHFLYFTIDGTSILAAHCASGSNQPVYIVQRSLSCRRAFHLQPLRTMSTKKTPTDPALCGQGKGRVPEREQKQEQDCPLSPLQSPPKPRMADDADWDFVAFRNEVPGYTKIDKCLADDMLPTFEMINKYNETLERDLKMLSEVFEEIDQATVFTLPGEAAAEPFSPPVIHDPDNAHISEDSEGIIMSQIMCHLGLKPPVSVFPSLYHTPYTIQLDHHNPGLQDALKGLDRIAIRPLDWVLAFYVGQDDYSVEDIVDKGDRVHECNEDYLRFLTSMAWLCRSEDLSSRRSATPAASATPITAMGKIDGEEWCLVHADMYHELGIVLPSSRSMRSPHSATSLVAPDTAAFPLEPLRGTESLSRVEQLMKSDHRGKIRSFSLDDVDHPGGNRGENLSAESRATNRISSRARKGSVLFEGRFFVVLVWMETFAGHEDFAFPAQEMLGELDLDWMQKEHEEGESGESISPVEYRLIYIYPAVHGMYELRLRNAEGNAMVGSIPMLNGMIVSHAGLGNLVRDTIINMFTRKRLALDSYMPGQIERRNAIQEITNRFRLKEITEASWGV